MKITNNVRFVDEDLSFMEIAERRTFRTVRFIVHTTIECTIPGFYCIGKNGLNSRAPSRKLYHLITKQLQITPNRLDCICLPALNQKPVETLQCNNVGAVFPSYLLYFSKIIFLIVNNCSQPFCSFSACSKKSLLLEYQDIKYVDTQCNHSYAFNGAISHKRLNNKYSSISQRKTIKSYCDSNHSLSMTGSRILTFYYEK